MLSNNTDAAENLPNGRKKDMTTAFAGVIPANVPC